MVIERLKAALRALTGKTEDLKSNAFPAEKHTEKEDPAPISALGAPTQREYSAPMVRRARNTLERRRQESGF